MDAILESFKESCRKGTFEPLQEWLKKVPDSEKAALLPELIAVELHYRKAHNATIPLDDYLSQFPECESLIRSAYQDIDATQNFSVPKSESKKS